MLVERLQYSRESCLCSWNCLIVLVVNGFLGSCVEEKLQFLFNNKKKRQLFLQNTHEL